MFSANEWQVSRPHFRKKEKAIDFILIWIQGFAERIQTCVSLSKDKRVSWTPMPTFEIQPLCIITSFKNAPFIALGPKVESKGCKMHRDITVCKVGISLVKMHPVKTDLKSIDRILLIVNISELLSLSSVLRKMQKCLETEDTNGGKRKKLQRAVIFVQILILWNHWPSSLSAGSKLG